MRKTAKLNDNSFLRDDAGNLPAFLYLLKEKHQKQYLLIVATIQSIAPYFHDFDLKPDRLNPDTIRLEWRHRGSDQYFSAASLSDGTLRFMALVTLLVQPKVYLPSIVIIDEPELGLHPAAISKLAEMIKYCSRHAQVIVSTQSPLLLDHFEPEDLVVADRENDKTNFSRLKTSKLKDWLESYGLGQLWEKNEIGGRPS